MNSLNGWYPTRNVINKDQTLNAMIKRPWKNNIMNKQNKINELNKCFNDSYSPIIGNG